MAEGKGEMEKRREASDHTWIKYQDSDSEEYSEHKAKVAGVKTSRGNRAEQRRRKRQKVVDSEGKCEGAMCAPTDAGGC